MNRLSVSVAILLSLSAAAVAQEVITLLGTKEAKGTIKSISAGAVVIRGEDGKDLSLKIQGKEDQGVPLGGAKFVIAYPAEVQIRGELTPESLKPGMCVQFRGKLNRLGKTSGLVEEILVFDEKRFPLGIDVKTPPEKPGAFGECEITAHVNNVANGKLSVDVPQNDFVDGKKTKALFFPLAAKPKIRLESDDVTLAKPGDVVDSVEFAEFSTGDAAIKKLSIRVVATAPPKTTAKSKPDTLAKFRKFSDDPSPPRDVASPHFLLHTDISDRSAQILLDKLETMIVLMAKYYGVAPQTIVECYVVRDLANFPNLPLEGRDKIAELAGVTISISVGEQTKSIVYSCDKHGVVQHECVHAFCAQTFGSTGPTWYSEGMAEMGQYWKDGQLAVDVDPIAIAYLTKAEPKKMLDIVKAGQITGDSWQAYCWRWALCHLLAMNPNYNGRFQGLGLGMMREQPGFSFENAYGPVADQISFEYDFFVRHFDNGYRADLCAWQWGRKFQPAKSKVNIETKLLAKYGWQGSPLRVEAGSSYDYVTEGNWKISATESVDGNGDANGTGRLVGIILNDFQLGEPIPMGQRGSFVAPSNGDLYIRCQDAWNQIADNEGELKVTFRRTPSADKSAGKQ